MGFSTNHEVEVSHTFLLKHRHLFKTLDLLLHIFLYGGWDEVLFIKSISRKLEIFGLGGISQRETVSLEIVFHALEKGDFAKVSKMNAGKLFGYHNNLLSL